MIKSSIVALLAVAAVTGTIAPSYAAYSLLDDNAYDASAVQYVQTINVINRLQDQGVNATSVEEWNGLVRAFVRQDNGSETMEFFTLDTLIPVSL